MGDADTVPVHIARSLHERLERHVEDAGFNDVQTYVTFVLEEVLRDEAAPPEADEATSDASEPEGYSEDEEAEVKERLQSLGYL